MARSSSCTSRTARTSVAWSKRSPAWERATPGVDEDDARVRIPVGSDGPAALLETVRRLDDTGIGLADIALHRPSLDDVFLSLTGHAAERTDEDADGAANGKKRGRKSKRAKEASDA